MSDIKWTDDRVKEFETLKQLIWKIESLNRGSNFLDKVTELIEAAKILERDDFSIPRTSFLSFLRDVMVDARMKERR